MTRMTFHRSRFFRVAANGGRVGEVFNRLNKTMTYEQAKTEIAKKHRLGTTLVTGHKASYFEEAALLYADQFKVKNLAQPDVSSMVCDLGRKFHECEIHRCSTYGCLNCGQYKKQT